MNVITGNFIRVGQKSDSYNYDRGAQFTISHRWIPDAQIRRNQHSKWFKLSTNKGSTYRTLSMSPLLKGGVKENEGELILDWQAWIELSGYSESVPSSMDITIKPIPVYQELLVGLKHSDPSYRLAIKIALFALVISILPIALSIFKF